jgi:hypothetical protein
MYYAVYTETITYSVKETYRNVLGVLVYIRELARKIITFPNVISNMED